MRLDLGQLSPRAIERARHGTRLDMQSRISLCRQSLNDFSAVKMATKAFLFPGQGSQYVGMTQKLSKPLAAESAVFRTAEYTLDYDLHSLCLSGPKSRLDETVFCQPAVVAASLAAAETVTQGQPVSECCGVTAGFSVGVITALIFAEALSIEAGLQLVQARAKAMHEACLLRAGTMLTVIGLCEPELHQMCQDVQTTQGGEVCIANHIFPSGLVISGCVHSVEAVGNRAQSAGASVKKLAVSGAFHSPLMQPAVAKLQSVLQRIQINMPKIPVYSNVTGRPYTSVGEIRDCLALQVTRPVLWEMVVRNMTRDHHNIQFYEVGPGKQLKSMLRRIDREAYKQCLNIEA